MMAGKKMMKKIAKMESGCCQDGMGQVESWILMLLGLLGLMQAVGYLPVSFTSSFTYIWAILVLVIGVSKTIHMQKYK